MTRVLVLNQSYEFLGFVDWKSAVSMIYTEKVIVEEEYDEIVHSPSISMNVPAVLRLRKYVKVFYEKIAKVSYSKRNVHLRDNFICQYCGEKKSLKKLGIDHVLPVSRGGKSTWENTVTACNDCNWSKADRMPKECGLELIRAPRYPRGFKEIIRIKIGIIHELWAKYL